MQNALRQILKSGLGTLCLIPLLLLGTGAENSAAAKTQTNKAEIKKELVVYTYSSFVSKWGPGPDIQKAFEEKCGCTLKWVSTEDGASLITRLRMEGDKTKADVVLGFDSNLISDAISTGLFDKYTAKTTHPFSLPVEMKTEGYFTPVDYGWFAVMYDSQKIKNPPRSLKELLENEEWNRKLLIQDPRTSTPGLGLLLWIKAVYGDDAPRALAQLKKQTLTVTKGWSEAYGLFTKGEAPLVLSYTTSEAYHLAEEKNERYKAALFEDGHYLQVEFAGLVKTKRDQTLAKEFLDFVSTPEFQTAVASKNWMYPAVDPVHLPALPAAFSALKKPEKTLHLSPEALQKDKKNWIDEWLTHFR